MDDPTETALWRTFRRWPRSEHRRRLADHYAWLAVREAHRVAFRLPAMIEPDELVADATFGLLAAIDRFEPARGFKFATYAVPRIRGAILDGLRGLDHVARTVRIDQKRVALAVADARDRLGREPTADDLTEELAVDAAAAAAMTRRARAAVPVSLDALLDDQTPRDQTLREMGRPDTTADRLQRGDLWRMVCRGLSKRDRLILIEYFIENRTMKAIGRDLGLSESRISQRMSDVMAQLRTRLAARRDEFIPPSQPR